MRKEKIWYILIDEKEEGPFSFKDLRLDRRLTPKTLARKFDWKEWQPIKHIKELEGLFDDPVALEDLHKKPESVSADEGEMALDLNPQNPIFLFLLLIIAILIFLLFYVANINR